MRLITKQRSLFGIAKPFYDALYINDPSHSQYNIAGASSHVPVPGVQTSVCTPVQSTYQTTKLASGITILTESVSVPSNVNLGILVDVGSRDENAETSGAMHLLRQIYLKTAINTNETVNYGIVQMAGGQFEVQYNRESVFYRVNCLSHDVIDVFSMLADCAFEPRNVVACSVGQSKLEDAHKLDAQTGGNNTFNDTIFTTAFGRTGLGNPLMGARSNISNLIAQTIQKFQLANVTTNRIVISASGIENHQEFVDLVSEKMHLTQLGTNKPEREASNYTGGEVRNYADINNFHLALAFEGASHANSIPHLIANEILSKNSGWIQDKVLAKNVFINDAQSFSASFSDSGLFGIKLAGSSSHINEALACGAQTLNALRNASELDVEIAKASLKTRLARQLCNPWQRMEDRARSLYYTGNVGENWYEAINNVSASQVTDAVSKSLNGPLTMVAQGGQVNTIGSYEKVGRLFQ